MPRSTSNIILYIGSKSCSGRLGLLSKSYTMLKMAIMARGKVGRGGRMEVWDDNSEGGGGGEVTTAPDTGREAAGGRSCGYHGRGT